MENIKEIDILSLFKGEKYSYLLEEFKEKKIKERFYTLYEYLYAFIETHQLEDKVHISVELLEQTLVDYFVDVYRLKKFHHIEKINDIKIHAFTAYWLANEKVLQMKENVQDKRLTAVNEWMAASYLISYLFKDSGKSIVINAQSTASLEEFKDNLIYSLRYRQFTPYMLETVLLAFQAGAGWQYSLDHKDE